MLVQNSLSEISSVLPNLGLGQIAQNRKEAGDCNQCRNWFSLQPAPALETWPFSV